MSAYMNVVIKLPVMQNSIIWERVVVVVMSIWSSGHYPPIRFSRNSEAFASEFLENLIVDVFNHTLVCYPLRH